MTGFFVLAVDLGILFLVIFGICRIFMTNGDAFQIAKKSTTYALYFVGIAVLLVAISFVFPSAH